MSTAAVDREHWATVYSARVPVLKDVATEIEASLCDLFRKVPRIDRISARVKAIGRFADKAASTSRAGQRRYGNPLEEIQDQIGARIVVFYRSDVDAAISRLLSEFREVENRKVEHPDPEYFAYEGHHLVCLIPSDIHIKYSPPIDFFEIQISTLFQHAWAEANHDLGYKPQNGLTYEDRRRIAWAAAQAWGADLILDQLWRSQSDAAAETAKTSS